MFFWNSKRVDEKIARLDAKLIAAFDKVKRDNAAVYQWLNFFYDEANKQKTINQHQQELIDDMKQRIQEIPTPVSRQEIKEMVDSFYDHEALSERIKHISEKLNQLETPKRAPAKRVIVQETAPRTALREKMIKKIARNSKDYIKGMIISLIRKYNRISAMALREMVVEEQALCSRSSFYRLLEEIEKEEGESNKRDKSDHTGECNPRLCQFAIYPAFSHQL